MSRKPDLQQITRDEHGIVTAVVTLDDEQLDGFLELVNPNPALTRAKADREAATWVATRLFIAAGASSGG